MLKSKRKNTITTFYESSNAETYLALSPMFEDDFFGAALDAYKWTVLDALGATELVASAENGVCALSLTNAAEIQVAGLYFGDICPFRLNRGPIFEARVRWTTLPAEVTKMTAVLGLAAATAADIDNITDSVWFRWDGDTIGLVTCESDDTAAGHEQSKITSAISVLINIWHIFRIDLTDPAAARFYIDGARVAKATTFNVDTDADQEYQPYIRLDKAANAGDLGVMEVDYVRVWETRD